MIDEYILAQGWPNWLHLFNLGSLPKSQLGSVLVCCDLRSYWRVTPVYSSFRSPFPPSFDGLDPRRVSTLYAITSLRMLISTSVAHCSTGRDGFDLSYILDNRMGRDSVKDLPGAA